MSTAKSVASSKSALSNPSTNLKMYRMQFGTFVHAPTLSTAYRSLVPIYKSEVYPNLVMKITEWTDEYARGVREISAKRAVNRIGNYCDPNELDRAGAKLASTDSATIRFGVKKEGHGYHGGRGDFCLLGGSVHGRHLHLFYRSLELIGGLAYDLCIIEHVGNQLGIEWKSVTFVAAKANVFALKSNSNEKLYPKFRRVLGI